MKKDDDLKQISASIQLMNGKLDAISKNLNDPKTGLAAINDRLEDPKTGLRRINEKLDALWDQTVKLTTDAEHVKGVSKNQSESLDRTNDNIKRVDKRLRVVENHSGIVSPPELAVFE